MIKFGLNIGEEDDFPVLLHQGPEQQLRSRIRYWTFSNFNEIKCQVLLSTMDIINDDSDKKVMVR